MLAGLGLATCTWLAPVTPAGALARLFSPASAGQAVEAAGEVAPDDEALVGDIVLRYLYPPYTGREPLEVPNSTGDIHAPPGTVVEIRARTAETWTSAALRFVPRSGDPTSEDAAASILGGRQVSASLEVRTAGAWHLVLARAGQAQRSEAHAVVPEPDLPPEVLLDAPLGTLDVAWDEAVPATWTARDDYGVIRVEAILERTEGTSPPPRVLRTPLDPVERVSEPLAPTPLDLGLLPGEAARIRVVAWDDDAVSGSKAGTSRALAIRVLGPRGRTARKVRMIEDLRDVLVLALADHLVDAGPSGEAGSELLAWGEGVARRLGPLEALADAWWEGFDPDTFEGTVVVAVREAHTSLLTFVEVLAARPDTVPVRAEDLSHLGTLHERTIAVLERGILTLDEAIRREALVRLVEAARQVAVETTSLLAIEDPVAARTRLDSLVRLFDQLDRAALDLGESALSTLVRDRVRDLRNRMAAAVAVLAEGRRADARRILEALARDASDLAHAVEDAQAAREGEAGRVAARLEALAAELAALEEVERSEADTIARVRTAHGDDSAQLAARWDAIGERARNLWRRLDRTAGEMRGEPWSSIERSLAAAAAAEARDLLRALDARDVDRAVGAAGETEWSVVHVRDVVGRYAEGRAALGRPSGDDPAVLRALDEAEVEAAAVRRMLDDTLRSLARPPTPLRDAAREVSARQEAAGERTRAAEREAGTLAPSLPMGAPGLVEGLHGTSEAIRRSTELLGAGRAMEGEGAVRSAADALAEAGRALQRALDDLRDLERFSTSREPRDVTRERRGDRSARPDPRGRVEIPAPEEFRTPEDYRRALLRGMEGEVPDEYETLKRRYYEELVRQ